MKEQDYVEKCGVYIKTIKIASKNWLAEDQMDYMISTINSAPEDVCIDLDFFQNISSSLDLNSPNGFQLSMN
jgi:hypothetical protein